MRLCGSAEGRFALHMEKIGFEISDLKFEREQLRFHILDLRSAISTLRIKFLEEY
jgi:hypothetical protein